MEQYSVRSALASLRGALADAEPRTRSVVVRLSMPPSA
jgi:hypothetical protein